MKKIKALILTGVILIITTGCFKKDEFQNINIYTTVHPIEYLTKRLYGTYADINNVYPDGIDISKYTITSKKINEFSKGHLFIYNGLGSEKQIAASLINSNKKLNIIDVSQGLEIKNEELELWISPANSLMIAQNIKNGLKDYVTSTSILEAIDNAYEELKLEISELDAELKLIAENSVNNTVIVANSSFDFLKKYGYNIVNISYEDSEVSTTAYSRAKNAFLNNENSYLFVFDTVDTEDSNIKELEKAGAKIVVIHSMTNLTDEERKNGDNYLTFMKTFIEAIKNEVY